MRISFQRSTVFLLSDFGGLFLFLFLSWVLLLIYFGLSFSFLSFSVKCLLVLKNISYSIIKALLGRTLAWKYGLELHGVYNPVGLQTNSTGALIESSSF